MRRTRHSASFTCLGSTVGTTGALLAVAFSLGCQAPATRSDAVRSVVPARVSRAVDRGASDGSETLRLVVGLKLRAPAPAGARPGERPLRPEEFADRHGRTDEEYRRVVSFFEDAGLRVVRTSPGRASLVVEGETAAVERALGVSIHRYEDAAGAFHAPTGEPAISESVNELLLGIVGLDDANAWRSHRREVPLQKKRSPRANPPAPYGPTEIRTLYGIDKVTQRGEGETVAILGAGPPPLMTDLTTFRTRFGEPALAANQYTQTLVGGPDRDTHDKDEYGENILDAECVLSTAPNANVVHVIAATNIPGMFTDGVEYIVNQLPQAHAVTLSYGSCERNSADEMPVLNALLAQARAQGQQWFVAAGDTGTDGCSDGQGNVVLSVGWPGSSPSAIGVGGTEIDSGAVETAWGNDDQGGGGGGASEAIDKPAYQIGVGAGAGDGARDTPDVSALAGGPGINTIDHGQLSPAEGTSAASPMWAGVWALVDQAAGGQGLPAGIESLYALGQAGQGFNDIVAGNITDGSTPGFDAVSGYDMATGWGTPNVASLIANWK